MTMNSNEANALGDQILTCVKVGDLAGAENMLEPVLSGRVPFSTLDRIGWRIGSASADSVYEFSDRLAESKKMGGWVIIASALSGWLETQPSQTLAHCRKYIIQADVWYATDTFGERVTGFALTKVFDRALQIMSPWRADSNRWVRRSVGVSVHLWAKRKRGASDTVGQAMQLLHFLEPTFEERNLDAVKGFGWGLKTMGKYYPELVAAWLEEQVGNRRRQPRAIMLRKAQTYLSPEQKNKIQKGHSL